MKKFVSIAVICLLLLSGVLVLASCGNAGPKNITVKEFLDKQGGEQDFTVTVKVVELLNPYYARVEDSTGSVLLFGLWENGEPKAFAEKGVEIGDTIVVKNPVYNVYEGNVEMKEGTLVEKRP